MANCKDLQLTFDQNNPLGDDTYVLKATLYEGLSLFYHATLSVLSTTLLSPNDLQKLYTPKVRLSLYQVPEDNAIAQGKAAKSSAGGQEAAVVAKAPAAAGGADADKAETYRCLCGKIRAAKLFGQVSQSTDKTKAYYHYEFTLVSPLQQLCDQHHMRSWTQQTVFAVIQDVLSVLGLTIETAIEENEQSSDATNVLNAHTQQIFVQHGESDAQFLQRLLLLHGLNLSFTHEKDAFVPKVKLSYGNSFAAVNLYQQQTSGDTSGTGSTNGTGGTGGTSSGGAAGKESQSTKVSLNSSSNALPLTDFVCGSSVMQSLSSAEEMLHSYPALLSQLSAVVSDDYQFTQSDKYKQLVTASLNGCLQLQQQDVQGCSCDLALQPAVTIKVTDYGAGMDFLVVHTVTTAVAPLPATISVAQDFLASLLGIKPKQRMRRIEVRMQLKQWTQAAYAGELQVQAVVQDSGAAVQVHSATVCNAAGEITLTSAERNSYGVVGNLQNVDSSYRPTIFYALLPDVTTPVVFSCQQGALAAHGGFCQYPSVGDKVLLLQNTQGFFFLGFDQNSTASHSAAHNDLSFDSYRAHQLQQSLSLEHVPQIAEAETDNQGKVKTADVVSSTKRSRLSFDNFASAADCVAYLCYYGSLEPIWRALASQYNNPALNQTYQDYGKALLTDAENIKAKHLDLLLNPPAKEDLKKEQSALKGDIDAFYDKIRELLVNSCQALGVSSKDEDNKLFTILHQMRSSLVVEKGNMLISAAQGTTMINGKKLNISALDSINLNAPKITINADSEVEIAVGGNTIGVSRNEISLESRKWTKSRGMLDSVIFINSIDGISMSGMEIEMSACFGAALRDAFGATLELNNGAVELGGSDVAMSTTTKGDTIYNLVLFTAQTLAELSNLAVTLSNGNSLNITKSLSYGIPAASDIVSCIERYRKKIEVHNSHESGSSATKREWRLLVANIINDVILQMVKVVQTIMFASYSAVLEKPVNSKGNFTVRDVLCAILLLNKVTTMILAMMELVPLQAAMKSASLVLNSEAEINLESSKFVKIVETEEGAASALASSVPVEVKAIAALLPTVIGALLAAGFNTENEEEED